MSWVACLVGLVTGICVRKASAGTATESIGRGALALVLTLTAIVGGRFVYAKYMQATNDAGGVTVKAERAEQPADDADESTNDNAQQVDVVPATEIEGLGGPMDQFGAAKKPTMENTFTEWDTLWMSLAALGAYITGKGGTKSPNAHVVVDEPTDETPAEQDAEQA